MILEGAESWAGVSYTHFYPTDTGAQRLGYCGINEAGRAYRVNPFRRGTS